MTLTVRYGLQTATRTYAYPPSVDELKRDESLRAELGFGDNCRVLVNGVEQSGYTQLVGPSVTIETAANQKALC